MACRGGYPPAWGCHLSGLKGWISFGRLDSMPATPTLPEIWGDFLKSEKLKSRGQTMLLHTKRGAQQLPVRLFGDPYLSFTSQAGRFACACVSGVFLRPGTPKILLHQNNSAPQCLLGCRPRSGRLYTFTHTAQAKNYFTSAARLEGS